MKKSQPGAVKASGAVAGARAAARNTDSAPAQPTPAEAARDDLPAQKAWETQARVAAQPHDANKSAEYEGGGSGDPLPGQAVASASPLATGSTLSERSANPKVGTAAAPGAQPLSGSLDRVRVDAAGQRLTTNQGVPVADNQHSLKAGARAGAAGRPRPAREGHAL